MADRLLIRPTVGQAGASDHGRQVKRRAKSSRPEFAWATPCHRLPILAADQTGTADRHTHPRTSEDHKNSVKLVKYRHSMRSSEMVRLDVPHS
jgi:hypothetical protein